MTTTSPQTSFAGSSSPPVPAVAARLRAKRQTMNLVNPAGQPYPSKQLASVEADQIDPDDFSTDSIPSSSSADLLERRRREITPTFSFPTQQDTPLVNAYGVKGILRPVGTPGSGNGVRFFPKNRFRVITPREELGGPSTPQKQPTPAPPPPKSPTSFFSQLLSVVPAMSPRRSTPVPVLPEIPDESWERPGEEGEISLVASSVASADRSTLAGEDDEDEEGMSLDVPAPWTGPAEVHSSPLFMPLEGSSRDISMQDLGQPEASMDDWKMRLQAQGDVSNLLSTSLPGTSETSFSIGSMAGPSYIPPPTPSSPHVPPLIAVSPGQLGADISSVSWMRADQSSLPSIPEEDDNPTIRRKLSPTPSPKDASGSRISPSALVSPAVPSPLPVRQPKGFTSIFADMSVEQAELSWPLARPKSVSPADASLRSSSPSIQPAGLRATTNGADSPIPTPSSLPFPSATPRISDTGNDTEFFDATSSLTLATPCPTKSSSGLHRLTSLRPSSYAGSLGRHTHLSAFVNPTQALFEAQQTHTSAVNAELAMYRTLAQRLGKEVAERDRALADLNLRLVESDMRIATATQMGTAQIRSNSSSGSIALSGRRKSLSPSPTPSPLAMRSAAQSHAQTADDDRARQDAETQVRDLEIRLEKAVAEQRETGTEVDRARAAEQAALGDYRALQRKITLLEEAERDRAISAARQAGDGQAAIDDLRRQLRDSRAEGEGAREQVADLVQARMADEQELGRLSASLDQAREGRKREERLNQALQQLQQELHSVSRVREEGERELEKERTANDDLEQMVRELKTALHQAQTIITDSTNRYRDDNAKLMAELGRLRAESSNKDLELLNLQRRKTELKEDREMLNIALDSKQQEVELLKRKFARSSNATPLGLSQKHNVDSTPLASAAIIQTPAAGHNPLKLHPSTAAPGTILPLLHAGTGGASKRRTSAAYATPLQANGRTMRSGAVLVGSTAVKDRVMRRDADGENTRPERLRDAGAIMGQRKMSVRESVLA